MDDKEALLSVLRRLTDIPDAEWDYLQQHLQEESLGKGEVLLHSGELCEKIYFCVSGLLRMYYITPEGADYNKSFITEHKFFTSYSSMILNVPSHFSIQSLETSVVVSFSHSTLEHLFNRHSCWETIGRKLVEQLYIKKELKERHLLLYSAEERYQLFLEEYPDLNRRVPQYHVASYLGISPVSLSRIRKSQSHK